MYAFNYVEQLMDLTILFYLTNNKDNKDNNRQYND